MKVRNLLALAALAAGSAASAAALSPKDTEFVNKAAVAGMAEVEQSKLALDRSSNSKIKSFADMMVSDHGSANRKLEKLAQEKGWTLPGALDGEAKSKVDTLGTAQGEAFDRQYVTNMKQDHDAAVALFREAAKNADDSALRGFATDTLPTLEQHRKQTGELPPAARRN